MPARDRIASQAQRTSSAFVDRIGQNARLANWMASRPLAAPSIADLPDRSSRQFAPGSEKEVLLYLKVCGAGRNEMARSYQSQPTVIQIRSECSMKRSCSFLLAANLCIPALIAGLNGSIAGSSEIDLTEWTPPDTTAVEDDPFGTLVKYGHALFTDTANQIGPKVSDPARRFAGNNLA